MGDILNIVDDFQEGEVIQALRDYGVGIDTHSKFIQVCVLVKIGGEVHKFEQGFGTGWNQILIAREWIHKTIREKSIPTVEVEPLRYTIESTGTYHFPVLKAFGGKPSVVNPLLASPSRLKTDVLDAKLLSYQNMTGLWPESFVVNDETQEFRIMLKQRQYHNKMATGISNRINNYILRFGQTIGALSSVTSDFSRSIIEDLCENKEIALDGVCPDGLPESVREIFPDMYKQFDEHKEKVKQYERLAWKKANEIEWEVRENVYVKGKELLNNLQTIPAIGEITSMVWLSQIVTPTRFKNSKAVSAYCGCDPSLKVSAGKVTSTTKRGGNKEIHTALTRAASTLIRAKNEPLGKWGYNIFKRQQKGGWKRACSAVARRLAVALYYVNMKNEPFSYEKYKFYERKDVPNIPLEEMNLGKFEKVLNEHGFINSKMIVDAYYECRLMDNKGIGKKCVEVIKEWIEVQK